MYTEQLVYCIPIAEYMTTASDASFLEKSKLYFKKKTIFKNIEDEFVHIFRF